jgi:hypothetical protein
LNRGKHVTALRGRSPQNNFKCALKGNRPELFTPITSNKNGCETNKNLKVMFGVINAQFLKKIVGVMVCVEMKLTPPLKMGNKTCKCTKLAFGHSKELGAKNLSKTCRRVESKEASWC